MMLFGPEKVEFLTDRISPVLRGALLPACLISAGLLFSSTPAISGSNPFLSENRQNDVRLNDWLSYDNRVDLPDGTQLYQYVAEVSPEVELSDTVSNTLSLPKIRFSFIPRFNCAPIISVVVAPVEKSKESRKQIIDALGKLKFSVDGTQVAYPSLTEGADDKLAAHYDTELQRRNTFRILVEVGSRALVEIEDYGQYNYSLSGSKRAITRSLSRCRSHTI